MSRSAMAIALALAILTGVVVGQLTASGSPDFASETESSERRLELVRYFYDGINTYLETGDDGFLRLLTPDFQDTWSQTDRSGTSATLIAHLDELRSSTIVPHFTVHEMNDLGQVVQTRVSIDSPSPMHVARFMVTNPMPGLGVEFLQVQGNAIVARWADAPVLSRIDAVSEAEIDARAAGLWRIEISHVILQPNTQLALEPGISSWVIVDHGAISIAADSTIELMEAGEGRSVQAESRLRVMNYDLAEASFWHASLSHNRSAGPYRANEQHVEQPGAVIDVLSDTLVVDPNVTSAHLQGRFARVELPPGAQFDPVGDLVAQHVIVIDGSVDAVVHGGQFMHFVDSGQAVTVRDQVSISTGTGVASILGGSATFRVSGIEPATLLLFTISA